MKITGMELVGVRVNQWLDWVFVLVDTDAGIRGLGELAPGGKTPDCLAALRDLGASLVGRDPRQIEPFVHERTRDQPERAHRLALSAVEQALWDILGKSLGVPVYRLLGGACREEIRLYANINRVSRRPEQRTPEFFARNAVAAVAEGFDAVKLAPFDGMPGEIDRARDVAPGIAATEAVRKAVGPGVDLLIDCHSHFTVAGALDVADALRDLDLFWFEQPTPESDLAGLRRIKEQSGMRIAGGEQRTEAASFWEPLERRALDVVMPDVTVVGGIGELRRSADLAAARGVPTAPHGPYGPVAIAAGVQTMAAHPQFLILEFGWGEADWRSELVLPPERIERGRIGLRDAPGLGLELNPEVVGAHRIEVA